jgi:uncharacterized protein
VTGPLEERLETIVRSSPRMMGWLEAARACCPPDWALGAGALRNLVWDHLTGLDHPPRDVDVVFFGGADQRDVEARLRARRPDVAWEVKDQALVHTWYERVFGHPVEPLTSVADAVGTWPETCTSVAVRLRRDGGLDVIAPCGLSDLFGRVLRRNRRRVTVERFRARLAEKRPDLAWPGVTVVDG